MGRPPLIRKVYLARPAAGSSTEYWEQLWLGEERRFDGPVRALLARHLPAEGMVLEAGCGQGQVAAGLSAAGHDVVGLDLARNALAECRRRHPGLPLVVADAARAPFGDRSFGAVVSLGVIEHFEAGPLPLLADHARLLADDGVLFLAVPARNWYRRWSELRHLGLRHRGSYPHGGRVVTLRRGTEPEPPVAGAFHQYEFGRRALLDRCTSAGLEVLVWQPFSVSSGIGEIPWLSRLAQRFVAAGGGSGGGDRPDATPPGPAIPRRGKGPSARIKAYLRAAVIDEEPHGVLGRAITWTITRFAGDIQLVVARRAR